MQATLLLGVVMLAATAVDGVRVHVSEVNEHPGDPMYLRDPTFSRIWEEHKIAQRSIASKELTEDAPMYSEMETQMEKSVSEKKDGDKDEDEKRETQKIAEWNEGELGTDVDGEVTTSQKIPAKDKKKSDTHQVAEWNEGELGTDVDEIEVTTTPKYPKVKVIRHTEGSNTFGDKVDGYNVDDNIVEPYERTPEEETVNALPHDGPLGETKKEDEEGKEKKKI